MKMIMNNFSKTISTTLSSGKNAELLAVIQYKLNTTGGNVSSLLKDILAETSENLKRTDPNYQEFLAQFLKTVTGEIYTPIPVQPNLPTNNFQQQPIQSQPIKQVENKVLEVEEETDEVEDEISITAEKVEPKKSGHGKPPVKSFDFVSRKKN